MPGPRTVRELLEARHGVRLVADTSRAPATIGTSAVAALPQSPSRVAFLFVNLSLNNIFLAPGQDPTAARGIRVDANGGTLALSWEEDGEVVGWEWRGIADGAASPVFAIETLIAPEG